LSAFYQAGYFIKLVEEGIAPLPFGGKALSV
jgi:hypothetical protein